MIFKFKLFFVDLLVNPVLVTECLCLVLVLFKNLFVRRDKYLGKRGESHLSEKTFIMPLGEECMLQVGEKKIPS